MTDHLKLSDSLTLPCGVVLPNRIAKAAMTEGVADGHNHATDRHVTLYRRWADGGLGLSITGNVQVDRRYLERGGNVAIEAGPSAADGFPALQAFAQAGKARGGHIWMQISHAGRQTPRRIAPVPVAPSAVRLNLPSSEFGDPRAFEAHEIPDLRDRFIFVAGTAKQAGFTGVQIHAAHGYVLSEFLSPLANQRTDDWGGSLRNRARLLLEIIDGTRAEVGPGFPISVKLNSSDFQKGGFTNEDCLQVVEWLNEAGVDLLEISGGTYEQPRMMNTDGVEPLFDEPVRESTRAREAYFMAYAEEIKAVARMPLMVTGGFRSRAGMMEALADGGVDVIGLGRPLCTDTDLPQRLLDGTAERAPEWEKSLSLGSGFFGPQSSWSLMKVANALAVQGWYYQQIYKLADGEEPDLSLSVFWAMLAQMREEARAAGALAKIGSRA